MNLDDFNALVQQTRLSSNSREAARLVLVDGKKQVEAADLMQLKPQRVGQILDVIEDVRQKQQKQVEYGVDAMAVISASHAFATKEARDKYGDEVRILEAKESKSFVGPAVARTDFHLVQFLGKDEVVIHELAKLDRVPPMGKNVVIQYERGRAAVMDRSQGKDRGGIAR